MSGKAWSRERHLADAARRANEAASQAQQPSQQTETQGSQVEPGAENTNLDDRSEARGKRYNPQWDALDEIAAASDKRQGFVDQTETTETPKEEAKAETPPAEVPKPDPQPAPEPAPEPSPEPAVAQATTLKQTVDGKEYDVPPSEIEEAGGERAWRINRAALNRLEAAKQAEAQAKATNAQTQQLAQWLQQQQQPQKPQHTDTQLLSIVRGGTDEEAAAAWQELQRRNAPPDPQAIENRTLFKMNQKTAADKFREEFSDIASNPHLMKLAAVMENEQLPKTLQDMGIANLTDPRLPLFDFGRFYRRIGNEIRGALPRPSQPQPASVTTGTPSQPSDKEARKASIVTLPTAAAPRAQPPAEEKPATREEILAEMAKSRGKMSPYG